MFFLHLIGVRDTIAIPEENRQPRAVHNDMRENGNMIHSFLLIGQSNMAGRGNLDEAVPVNSEHIKILRNGRWMPMFRPINPDRAFAGVSLAESFAERYAQTYGVDVGLIGCADGGTRLEQWRPGGLLFDNAVYQARLASRTSTIAGVLWHQGESDCADNLYPLYRERLETMMHTLRDTLDLQDVPFVLGGLGAFLTQRAGETFYQNYVHINRALQEIAANNPMTGFVSADGLTGKDDHLHFNSESLYAFGHRYYEVFETLRDPHKVFEEKPDPDEALRTAIEAL